jgi:predicted phosphoribosyltransferase
MSDMQMVLFRDRRDAGARLAQALGHYRGAPDAVVLGLPRGGVVVGSVVSVRLGLPLDVLVTRKLGTPGNPELAMGAVCETGYRFLNEDVIRSCGARADELDQAVAREQVEITRRIERYRQGRPLTGVAGKTVILVDDGIATGATFYASLAALRAGGVGRLVAAVPVAPCEEQGRLTARVDEVALLATPRPFYAIGQFYEDFAQLEDDEVMATLRMAREACATGPAGSRAPELIH